MRAKAKAFLKQAGIEIRSETIEQISTFLNSIDRKIVFNHGQLYFIDNKKVVESISCRGEESRIVELDRDGIREIDSIYYLGEVRADDNSSSRDSSQDRDYSNNNNNNNNNNNGNNG